GLSMRTLAAWHFPKMKHRFLPDGWSDITIDADVPDASNPEIFRPAPSKPTVHATGTDVMISGEPDDRLEYGLQPGDSISQTLVNIPAQATLEGITHPLLEVFRASPAQRKTWFKGRAIFVANMTPVAADRFDYPDGRSIWGVYGHATAFESLLT